jgi:hypothetical protein
MIAPSSRSLAGRYYQKHLQCAPDYTNFYVFAPDDPKNSGWPTISFACRPRCLARHQIELHKMLA